MSDTTTIDQTDLITAAIARHGPRRVMLGALRALLRTGTTTGPAAPVTAHLRRDIGLRPEEPPPTWELLR